MFLRLFALSLALDVVSLVYPVEYEEITHKNYATTDEIEFEPVTALSKEKEKYVPSSNINCDDFTKFALNCTIEAALIYNTTGTSPPMPQKIDDWCKAIKHLVNCAIDWNADCKDVTQDHFNEEGIKGHIHVVRSVCDDDWFLARYADVASCVVDKGPHWEVCYSFFKNFVEKEKNTTHEWTHYDTHFNLCCARAQFRRCTLNSLFRLPTNCTYENAVTLQKFSVMVSEGAVYQDCDRNMMYNNCPDGDPRPSKRMLANLMSLDALNKAFPSDTTLWKFLVSLFCFDMHIVYNLYLC